MTPAAKRAATRVGRRIPLLAGSLLATGCLVIKDGPADTTATGEPASIAAAAGAQAARDSIAGRMSGTSGTSSQTSAGSVGRVVARPIGTLSALGSEADSVARRGAPPVNAGRATGDVTRIEPLVPATTAEIAVLRGALTMPIASVAPSQLFDSFDEKRGSARRHEAIDIPAPRGTPVLSATAGRVMRLYSSKDGGLMVYTTDETERFILMYAHLDGYAPGLADGATLTRGQPIGIVGTTGNAPPNVPHLHFAIARTPNVARWWTGVPLNPYPLLYHP